MEEEKNSERKNEFSEQCKKFSYISEGLMEFRRQRNKSREEMAEALNVSKAYIEKLETSKVKIPAYAVWKYSEVLDIPIDRFFPNQKIASTRDYILGQIEDLNVTVLACLWDIIQAFESSIKSDTHIYETPGGNYKTYLRNKIKGHLEILDIDMLSCLQNTIGAFRKEADRIEDETKIKMQRPRT